MPQKREPVPAFGGLGTTGNPANQTPRLPESPDLLQTRAGSKSGKRTGALQLRTAEKIPAPKPGKAKPDSAAGPGKKGKAGREKTATAKAGSAAIAIGKTRPERRPGK